MRPGRFSTYGRHEWVDPIRGSGARARIRGGLMEISRRWRNSPRRCNSLKLSRPICSDCHAKARVGMRRKNERRGGERTAQSCHCYWNRVHYTDYICERRMRLTCAPVHLNPLSVIDVPKKVRRARVNTRRAKLAQRPNVWLTPIKKVSCATRARFLRRLSFNDNYMHVMCAVFVTYVWSEIVVG